MFTGFFCFDNRMVQKLPADATSPIMRVNTEPTYPSRFGFVGCPCVEASGADNNITLFLNLHPMAQTRADNAAPGPWTGPRYGGAYGFGDKRRRFVREHTGDEPDGLFKFFLCQFCDAYAHRRNLPIPSAAPHKNFSDCFRGNSAQPHGRRAKGYDPDHDEQEHMHRRH